MSKCEGEFLKTFVRISLRMIGIFPSKKLSVWYSSVYTICLIIGLCGSAVGFFNSKGISGRIESLGIFCVTFANCCVYVTSLLSRCEIKKLLNTLQGDASICSRDILQEAGEFVNGKILLLTVLYLILTFLFVFPSFIAVLIFRDRIPQSDENLEVIPYWFFCGDGDNRVVKFVCWRVRSKLGYFFKNCVELVFCIVEYFASNYFIVLYCIVMAEFYVHKRIFKDKVEFLAKYTEWFAAKYRNLETETDAGLKNIILEDYFTSANEELEGIIKYQQFLKRCAREINVTFKTFNDVLIAEYFAALIFAILMIFYKSENAMLFKCIPLFIHETLSLCLLCYFAQIISDSNETISCEFSKIPWYEQDVRFRKMYLMVMTQNYVPIRAKLCNARVLNLRFLLSTFRSLYSILNLLLLEIGK